MVARHPLFSPLTGYREPSRDGRLVSDEGWAVVTTTGEIVVHPTRLASAEEWAWVFAHLLLHLGFGHTDPARTGGTSFDLAHSTACDVAVNRFLTTLRLGRRPAGTVLVDLPSDDESRLAARWRREGVPAELRGLGVAGKRSCLEPAGVAHHPRNQTFEQRFAAGLTAAVGAAIDVAGGRRESLTSAAAVKHPWEIARSWFTTSYPLLGALFSTLRLVADAELAKGWEISIAAVSVTSGEVYVNPVAPLTQGEWRFVLAHEALHAALAHHARVGGRDPYLWNLACDFVINGWLVEMGVGVMPEGLLLDHQFKGMSAESVYDRIAAEARRYRKLSTLRGRAGDLVEPALGRPRGPIEGTDLDDLLRRALAGGLVAHQSAGRGLVPSGLVEEIRALAHPPITWDVALARWFDEHFPAVDRARSYARPSRRQAATPDIPRAGHRVVEEEVARRTFGVVLDTSGSMDSKILGKALGAIAAYATAREVPAARVVFCDAAAYDAGFLAVDDIAGKVRVRGRGGTVLQPGVDLLERAEDFPASGPILVITDGDCDVLRVRREHAYLMPAGATVPFTPRGRVFRIE